MTGPGRPQIQPEILRPEGQRVVAAPVDTFVQPKRRQSIARLADSLGQVSTRVAQFGDLLAERTQRRDTAEGQQEARRAMEEGAKSFQDAINQGIIAPDQSPFFRRGAKELFGRVSADRMNTALQHAIVTNPDINESTDPEDFDAFVGDFQQKWLADNVGDEERDLAFEAGFGPRNDMYLQNSRSAFGAQAGGRLMEQVRDNVFNEVSGIFQDQLENILPMDEAHRAIKLTMERARVMGLPARQANRVVAQAVIAEAVSRGDTSILDMLDNIQAGSGPLGGVRDIKQAVDTARSQIIAKMQGQLRFEEWQKQLEIRDQVQTQTSEVMTQLLDAGNPAQVNLDDAIRELAEVDTAAALNLYAVQDRMVEGTLTDNPQLVEDFVIQVWNEPRTLPDGTLNDSYVDMKFLTGQMGNGNINRANLEAVQRHMNARDQQAATGRDPREAAMNRAFNDALSNLQSRFKTGLFGNFASPAAAIASGRAEFAFRERFLLQQGQEGFLDTGALEMNKWLSDNAENLFSTFNQGVLAANEASSAGIPEAFNWRSVPQTNMEQLVVIEEQLRADALTDETIDLLDSFGVNPTPDEIAEFLAVQAGLLTTIGR